MSQPWCVLSTALCFAQGERSAWCLYACSTAVTHVCACNSAEEDQRACESPLPDLRCWVSLPLMICVHACMCVCVCVPAHTHSAIK